MHNKHTNIQTDQVGRQPHDLIKFIDGYLGQKKLIVSGHIQILNWRYGEGFFLVVRIWW